MMSISVSIIVIFYNMKREALRTLFSLTSAYQNVDPSRYEVLVIDNASPEPLAADLVQSFGSNFRYYFFDTCSKSPCRALNFGAQQARGSWIVPVIDGARILSPGILSTMMQASLVSDNPFIYTASLHLGDKPQNVSIVDGYSQTIEDDLLDKSQWMIDGYNLFNVSCWAYSSKLGYFSTLSESNCFMIRNITYQRFGGYDERFEALGGGLANLDIFRRLMISSEIEPILLLGEGTFHQIHGGIATNVRLEDHPFNDFQEEYTRIRGKPFGVFERKPLFFGKISTQCRALMGRTSVADTTGAGI